METDRFVEVMGARVRYRVEGSGPPAVLIHGIGASLEFWQWTVPALRERYTTIALDFPGFGLSDPIATAATPEGSAAATLAFMDAVGVPRAVIIGSSLGGAIASLAAGTAPERCAALVLAAPAGFGTGLSTTLRLMTIRCVGEGFLALTCRFPRLGLREAFADQRRIPDALVEITRRNAARPVTGETFLNTLRASATLRGVRPEVVEQARAVAARITAPTLIVWGTRDHVIPPDQAEVAGRTIPGARVHIMQGMGHVPFIEDAGAFNATLSAFLGGGG
ncbi:MAG: alpha/beta fold hydrolase [bacterium]|nr:alpha/beta fold hydrolase [bacterium]